MRLTILLAVAALVGPAGSLCAQNAPLQLQRPAPSTAPPAAPSAGAATSAINRAAAPPRVVNQDAATIIARANGWLNANATIIADFTQLAADGRKTTGTLNVAKPGRLRFDYDAPATLQIIADGSSVAVRNKRLNTQDISFIGQTPLKFLLKDHLDLSRDVSVLDARIDPTGATIWIEDHATFGGTSRIALTFDPQSYQLKKWIVTDPQGYVTTVTLANLDSRTKPDPALFQISTDRF